MIAIFDLASAIITEDQRAYRPVMARALGSARAAVLLQAIVFRYAAAGKKPFYCINDSLRGDLALSPRKFTIALARIGFKIMYGRIRENAPNALVYYWSDRDGKTWYEINETVLKALLIESTRKDGAL